MDTPTRTFVSSLGGYQEVAKALRKKPQTIHTAMQAGVFPSAWYDALCQMAREAKLQEPPRSLFSFLQLEERAA
ncbi:hypothetical protein [uncultured Ruegeria sp.]|uniref:hypothetical protein n=1 Tax=uncultured Ruegeria sp. TaxID=259304 RepID=UPI00261B3091|nr:hypothetical protein [uncultured Ruegeria sp.]